jgi:hypothetical protein|nr:MAG TPA: hypothetical protein [Caudoviricetes sp.]
MNPIDLGLIRQSYTDKFNQLYTFCRDNALKSKSLNGGKFLEIINNIRNDLRTIKAKGTKEMFDKYKTSLVPTLEAMEREIKYFQ